MLKKIRRFIFKAALYFLIITVGLVIIFRLVPVPYTFLMVQRLVQQEISGKAMRLQKNWVSLDKIANPLQLAVVASEDQNFLQHHGFDLEAIQKAFKHNERQKNKRRPKMHGASTISQQTAKNVFLFPGRNFIRKGFEVYFTGLIELCWSKKRIMEVYLNVIEMGDGIYGAESAAQYYFHKAAKDLSASEAALIAACLPNPIRFNASRPSDYILQRRSFILNQMMQLGGKLSYGN